MLVGNFENEIDSRGHHRDVQYMYRVKLTVELNFVIMPLQAQLHENYQTFIK